MESFIFIGNIKVVDIKKFLYEKSPTKTETILMGMGIDENDLNNWFADNDGFCFNDTNHVLNSIRNT